MDTTIHPHLNLTNEELTLVLELLESERTKLLVEIRHADHRAFRDELRHRLSLVEELIQRWAQARP